VRAGGGRNHRAGLSDAVLVKDNHLGSISIGEAVARAKQWWPARLVEVECDRLTQVEDACLAGAGAVLLDNMSPEEARRCVELVRRLARGRLLVEVSGRVSLEDAPRYAAARIDLISVGALTHSVESLDFGLDLSRGGG
jgi:nicotinate-nucleotide pyrophosphorylase (carboxylating)